MNTGYQVMDAMTTKPVSVSPETTLKECSRLMGENRVSSLVIKKDGSSIGIITEQDIVRKVVAKGINPLEKNVSDFMASDLHTIKPDSDIYEALIKMRDLGIRHLPVVSGNNMIGLLTLKDILKIQPSLFELIAKKMELREEQRKPINRIIASEGICQECGEYSEELEESNGVMVCSNCSK